jgi:DNA-binding winged helix-turn-helix (wHTH) protein
MDLEFGNYRLKAADRLLLGPHGPVELSARSFDILAMLLEKPDKVIGKAELFEGVWRRASWSRKIPFRCTFPRCERPFKPE